MAVTVLLQGTITAFIMKQDKYIPSINLTVPTGWEQLSDNQLSKRSRWFSHKYYVSVMRLKEFYEENPRRTFCGILSSALSRGFRRNH